MPYLEFKNSYLPMITEIFLYYMEVLHLRNLDSKNFQLIIINWKQDLCRL